MPCRNRFWTRLAAFSVVPSAAALVTLVSSSAAAAPPAPAPAPPAAPVAAPAAPVAAPAAPAAPATAPVVAAPVIAPVSGPVVAPVIAPVVVPAPAAPTVVVVEKPAPEVVVVEKPTEPTPSKVLVVEDDDTKVKIVVNGGDDDDDDDDDEIIEEVVEEHHHHVPDIRWAGLSVSTVFSPVPSNGRISEGTGRLGSNKFRACLKPRGQATCGYVKGFDFKVQIFESKGSRDYPTVVGYFRTGYSAGRVDVDSGSNDFLPGQVTSMRYVSVPLYFGGNIYAFGDFPVRPYAGMGAGFDILRLDYRRKGTERRLDASGRIGFELHAGIEGRISNFVSLHAEVMQLWSARRKLDGVPDVATTGLSVLAGVSVAIPTNLSRYREHHHTTKRTRRIVKD